MSVISMRFTRPTLPIFFQMALLRALFLTAGNIERYGQNLLAGKCSARRHSHAALRKAGLEWMVLPCRLRSG